MSFTQSALKKLSKGELIDLALEYQSKFGSTLNDISKEILERRCWSNCQYPGRECISCDTGSLEIGRHRPPGV